MEHLLLAVKEEELTLEVQTIDCHWTLKFIFTNNAQKYLQCEDIQQLSASELFKKVGLLNMASWPQDTGLSSMIAINLIAVTVLVLIMCYQ